MISFCIALAALIIGFFTYGKFVERVFGIDPDRKTPAIANPDGVDFVPLSGWKIFMIQFLNIAGLGPIFGAIMGAKFGTSSFLWIVFGTIFAGAVHDFMAGMISLRHNGESLPETIGRYLGVTAKQIMRFFTVILMILVGVVFVAGPADLLAMLTPQNLDSTFWIFVIFAYYILATMFPIDKIIGRIYPAFAVALIFMAIGILFMLFISFPDIPEITDGLSNKSEDPENNPIFPMLFISIACGAISGFHATQSPLMARCMTNERQGRYIFYGAMVTEGIVALIWAAAATYFFSPEGQAFFHITEPEKSMEIPLLSSISYPMAGWAWSVVLWQFSASLPLLLHREIRHSVPHVLLWPISYTWNSGAFPKGFLYAYRFFLWPYSFSYIIFPTRPDLKKFGDILRGVIKHWLYSPFGLLPYIYPEKGNLIG